MIKGILLRIREGKNSYLDVSKMHLGDFNGDNSLYGYNNGTTIKFSISTSKRSD